MKKSPPPLPPISIHEKKKEREDSTIILDIEKELVDASFSEENDTQKVAQIRDETGPSPQTTVPRAKRISHVPRAPKKQKDVAISGLAEELSQSASTEIASLIEVMTLELESEHLVSHRRAQLLFELGHLQELLYNNLEKAETQYQQAYHADPSFIPALRSLRRCLENEKRWQKVIELLKAELKATGDEKGRAYLLIRMGMIYWRELNLVEQAEDCLKKSLTLLPNGIFALELLRAIYSKTGQWKKLTEILASLRHLIRDDKESAHLTAELAEIVEFKIGDVSRAQELYSSALKRDADNQKAVLALRRLFLIQKRWKPLEELLTVEAGTERDPDEMYADMYYAARITELYLHDDERAASLMETSAALRLSDPLPLIRLKDIYQRRGQYKEEIKALKRALELAPNPLERANLNYQIGRLYEDALQHIERAEEFYRQALKEKSDHQVSMRALGALFRRSEQWDRLCELELLRAERYSEDELRADVYLEAARISENHLKDQKQAIELYERAWRLAPKLLEAFIALERIYRQSESWEDLARTYEQRFDTTADKALKISVLRALADIAEQHLANPKRAIEALKKLRTLDTKDRESLIALSRLYSQTNQHGELRHILNEWADLTEDKVERIELLRRVGDIWDECFHHKEKAIDIYLKILDEDPKDRPTRKRLTTIYERLGRWEELVDCLDDELNIVDTSEHPALLLWIGQVQEEKLGDLSAAEKAYESAFEIDPGYTPARLRLIDVLRRQKSYQALVDLLVKEAKKEKHPQQAAAKLCQAAELQEVELDDLSASEKLFIQAHNIDPNAIVARQGLERIYLRNDDVAKLEEHYTKEAEISLLPLLKVRAYLRLASNFDRKGDALAAKSAYESILKIAPGQRDSLYSLASICRRQGDESRLQESLSAIAANTDDPKLELLSLAEWALLVLDKGDISAVSEVLERMIGLDSDQSQALWELDKEAYKNKNTSKLFRFGIAQADLFDDANTQASYRLRAALASVIDRNRHEAIRVLLKSSKSDYLPLLQLLRQLYRDKADISERVLLLEHLAKTLSSSDLKYQALIEAADIAAQELKNDDWSKQILMNIFERDQSHEGAYRRLAKILTRQEKWKDRIDLAERRLALVQGATRSELLLEISAIYSDRLSDLPRAIESLERVLNQESKHLVALNKLSVLCAKVARWNDASEYLKLYGNLLEERSPKRKEVLFKRAEILKEHLGKEEIALEVLQGLLKHFPNERKAYVLCSELFQRWNDWPRAVEALKKIAQLGEPLERIETLVELSEICINRLGLPKQAEVHLVKASEIAVGSGEGEAEILGFFERRGDFDLLVKLWQRVLDGMDIQKSSVPLRVVLSKILVGRLRKPNEAENIILGVLKRFPESIDARLQLASLFSLRGKHADACTEYLKIIGHAPFCHGAYHGLVRVFDRLGDIDRCAGAAVARCALGQGDDLECALSEQVKARVNTRSIESAASSAFTNKHYWLRIAHEKEPRSAAEVLALISTHIPQLYTLEDKSKHTGKMSLETQHPLMVEIKRLSAILNLPTTDVQIQDQTKMVRLALRANGQMGINLAKEFSSKSQEQIRFELMSNLARVYSGTIYLDWISKNDVLDLFHAAISLFDKTYHGRQSPKTQSLAKDLNRALPRRTKRALEEPIVRLEKELPLNIDAWRDYAQMSAYRFGLLLSGDLKICLDALTNAGISETSSFHADLLSYCVSPHYTEARRMLQLL